MPISNLPLELISPEADIWLNFTLSSTCKPKSTSWFTLFILALKVPWEGDVKIDSEIVPSGGDEFNWWLPSLKVKLVPAIDWKIESTDVLKVAFTLLPELTAIKGRIIPCLCRVVKSAFSISLSPATSNCILSCSLPSNPRDPTTPGRTPLLSNFIPPV